MTFFDVFLTFFYFQAKNRVFNNYLTFFATIYTIYILHYAKNVILLTLGPGF